MRSDPFIPGTIVKLALACLAFAAAAGVGFAAWADQGAGIFMATVDAGLAWCF